MAKIKEIKEAVAGKCSSPEEKQVVTDTSTVKSNSSGLIFSVQIETSESRVALNSSRFKGLSVKEYQQDKLYKYYTGSFAKDLDAAKNYKLELQEKGFQHAFVIAFFNGERISIEKAIKLAEK